MQIEHSQLLNEFISWWFETRIDGELRYETILNFFPAGDWYTCPAGEETILLRGKLDLMRSDDEMVSDARLQVEAAIIAGRI
jgi:hypothetical protein